MRLSLGRALRRVRLSNLTYCKYEWCQLTQSVNLSQGDAEPPHKETDHQDTLYLIYRCAEQYFDAGYDTLFSVADTIVQAKQLGPESAFLALSYQKDCHGC
jgi:hypothetical protein